MSLYNTPRANRLHIGIYGRRNSGKSTLINALTGQEIALTSDVAGTTTDPVYKTMEVYGIGPCIFIDTAGFDDEGELGALRIKQTKKAVDKTDIALVVFTDGDWSEEKKWISDLQNRNIPVIAVLNKSDILKDVDSVVKRFYDETKLNAILVSAINQINLDKLRAEIIANIPEDYDSIQITGDLCGEGDLVLLVMPQDIQAPKGRLILPQVQTMRELLDKKCLVMSCTTDKLDDTLNTFKYPPKLIITDSQVFKLVHEKKPKESLLTSFSMLFAKHKGDINAYMAGAKAIDNLTEQSKVLIAEACTHVPLDEDIGRIKLPRLLRNKVGQGLQIVNVTGADFPEDLSEFDMVITCGGCMFNRKHILSRIRKAENQGVPISNYGVVIAYLNGILDDVVV